MYRMAIYYHSYERRVRGAHPDIGTSIVVSAFERHSSNASYRKNDFSTLFDNLGFLYTTTSDIYILELAYESLSPRFAIDLIVITIEMLLRLLDRVLLNPSRLQLRFCKTPSTLYELKCHYYYLQTYRPFYIADEILFRLCRTHTSQHASTVIYTFLKLSLLLLRLSQNSSCITRTKRQNN